PRRWATAAAGGPGCGDHRIDRVGAGRPGGQAGEGHFGRGGCRSVPRACRFFFTRAPSSLIDGSCAADISPPCTRAAARPSPENGGTRASPVGARRPVWSLRATHTRFTWLELLESESRLLSIAIALPSALI